MLHIMEKKSKPIQSKSIMFGIKFNYQHHKKKKIDCLITAKIKVRFSIRSIGQTFINKFILWTSNK